MTQLTFWSIVPIAIVALYVADYLSRKGLALDDTIVVDKAGLMEATPLSPFLPRTHHLRQ